VHPAHDSGVRAETAFSDTRFRRWQNIVFFIGLLLVAIGLPLSRTALSIGLAGVLACGVLHTRWRSQLQIVTQSPLLWAPLLWIAALLASYVYSENVQEWYFLVRISLPYLFFPLGIALAFGTLSDANKHWLYAAFSAGLALICLFTLYQYLQNPAYYHLRLLQSKEIPIANGINHLSFGLMHAWAVHLCYTLWVVWKRERKLTLAWGAVATGVFLVLCLHVFASRTGLVACYAAALLRLGAYAWQHPAARLRMVATASIALFLICCVSITIPTLRNKIQNSITDLDYYAAGARLDDWSLGRRLAAWQTAWHVGQQNPILGVAPADVSAAMQSKYEQEPFRFDDKALRAGSHNQFLESFAGMGLVGLGLLLLLLFSPLWIASVRKQGLAWAFYGILVTGCMTDTMLQAQIGPNFHLLFAYLVLYQIPATPSTLGK